MKAGQSFKHVMVMGAGAVGGYFGGRIAHYTDARVTLVARGKHLESIRDQGLTVKSVDGDFIVEVEGVEDPKTVPTPDLILFTVKAYDTVPAIQQLKEVVNDHITILSLQNGIENYQQLKRIFGENRVIPGLCQIGVKVSEPGVITHSALGSITAGELDGEETYRLRKLNQLLERAEIPFKISHTIIHDMWAKFSWNCVFNMLTAVTLTTVDELFSTTSSEELCRVLYAELQSVAKAEGVTLSGLDEIDIVEKSRNLKGFTTSTFTDRVKGKKLEYETFTGYLLRLADKHEIEIPHHRMLYTLLQIVDSQERLPLDTGDIPQQPES